MSSFYREFWGEWDTFGCKNKDCPFSPENNDSGYCPKTAIYREGGKSPLVAVESCDDVEATLARISAKETLTESEVKELRNILLDIHY